MPLIESLLWTPVAKQKQMCTLRFHLLCLYIGELNFGQNPYGTKPRCYWEHLGNAYGNTLGTFGNKLGTREKYKKNPVPPTSQKEKNWIVHECMLSLHIGRMKFYFQNCQSPFLAWTNGRGRNLVTLVIRFGKFGQAYQFKHISQPGN
jgi:hypothetical protein